MRLAAFLLGEGGEEGVEGLGSGRFPGEAAGVGESGLDEALAQGGVGGDLADGGGEGGGVVGVDEEGCIGGEFGEGAGGGCEYGRAAGLRFQQGKAESFVERWVEECRCAGKQRGFVGVGNVAGEVNALLHGGGQRGDGVADGLGQPAHLSRQNELVGDVGGGVGLYQSHQIFARLDGAEEEQVGWGDGVAGGGGSDGGGVGDGV